MKLTANFFNAHKAKAYLLLVLLPVLLYLKGLAYPFSPMDEQWLIIHDVAFLQKWSNLFGAFKESIQSIYYRPVFNISLILDYHVGELNPTFYHFINLLFHVLATVLLFRFLLLLQVNSKWAFFLALLFSAHPVLVHAVEWIPGRNDSMLGVFSLLSFIFLIRYTTQNKIHFLFLHVLFFVLALLTKENAVVLPLVFAALFFIDNKADKKLLLLCLCWLAALALWYVARNTVVSYFPKDSNGNSLLNLKEFFMSLLAFTGKAIFPVSQSVAPTPANSSVIPGLVAVATLLFLYYKFGAHNKKIAFSGIFTFVILLILPVWYGAISPLGEQYEHRIYTPLIGLIIFLSQLKINVSSRSFGYVMAAVLILFSIKTFSRIDVYKSELSYLDEGIDDCPENYVFHFQKGNLLYANHDFNPAVTAFNSAILLHPQRAQLFHNRGNAYFALGKYKESIDDYTAALKLAPNNPAILLARCNAYNKNNDINHAMGDLQILKQCCKDVVPSKLEQKITEKWINAQFIAVNTLLLSEPGHAEHYVARARLFFNIRNAEAALGDLKKACELEPGNAQYKAYYDRLNSTYQR